MASKTEPVGIAGLELNIDHPTSLPNNNTTSTNITLSDVEHPTSTTPTKTTPKPSRVPSHDDGNKEKDQQQKHGNVDVDNDIEILPRLPLPENDLELWITYHNLSLSYNLPKTKHDHNAGPINPILGSLKDVANVVQYYGLNDTTCREPFYRVKNLDGVLKPGESTLLIGDPGSGRSTYMKLLSGHLDPTQGVVLFNGLTRQEAETEQQCQVDKLMYYLSQEDTHFNQLTVKQTLEFTHNISTPCPNSLYIDTLIDIFGMKECTNTLVGACSGGQRRRLSTMISLCNPSIKLALHDQSNDGLDSAMTERINIFLTNWCRENKTHYVAAMNQVSPVVFNLFDNIMIFRDGCVIYHGPTSDVPIFLEGMGYPPPHDVDLPSHILNVLVHPKLVLQTQYLRIAQQKQQDILNNMIGGNNNNFSSQQQQQSSYHKKNNMKRNQLKTCYGGNVMLYKSPSPCITLEEMLDYYYMSPYYVNMIQTLKHIEKLRKHKSLPVDQEQFNTIGMDTSNNNNNTTNNGQTEYLSIPIQYPHKNELLPLITQKTKKFYGLGYNTTVLSLFAIVLQRQITLTWNNKSLIVSRLLPAAYLSVLFGGMFFNIPATPENTDVTSIMASLIDIFTQFSYNNLLELGLSIMTRPILHTQLRLYPTWIYTLAVQIVAVPIAIIEVALFTAISYPMIGHATDIMVGVTYYWLFLIHGLVLGAFFRCAASMTSNLGLAYTVVAPLVAALTTVGGFYLKPSDGSLPIWLIWLHYISPFAYFLKSVAINEFSATRYNYLIQSPTQPIGIMQRAGDVFLLNQDFPTEYSWVLWSTLYCLAALFILLSITSYFLYSPQHEYTRGTQRNYTTSNSSGDGSGGNNQQFGSTEDGGDDNALVFEIEQTLQHMQEDVQMLCDNVADLQPQSPGYDSLQSPIPSNTNGCGTPIPIGGNGSNNTPQQQQQQHQGSSTLAPQMSSIGQLPNAIINDNNNPSNGYQPQPTTIFDNNNDDVELSTIINSIRRSKTTNDGSRTATAGDFLSTRNTNNTNNNKNTQSNNNKNNTNSSGSGSLYTLTTELPFTPMTLAWNNLSFDVDAIDEYTGKKYTRRLLQGVSGYCAAGSSTALMGSSGAGKSTLLNTLYGMNKTTSTSRLTGDIFINGKKMLPSEFLSSVAFVEQFDTLYPYSTVYETLLFTARMKLINQTDDLLNRVVMEVLDVLELTSVKNLLIGSPMNPILSPSQRKRVAIGIALCSNPSIIFCDEATTGLSSTAALSVVRVLNKIARSGRAVITTVHQPNAELFFLFDSLLLLASGGYPIFFGPLGRRAESLVRYLQRIDGIQLLKTGINPAEWLIEQQSRDLPNQQQIKAQKLYENYYNIIVKEARCKDDRTSLPPRSYNNNNDNTLQQQNDTTMTTNIITPWSQLSLKQQMIQYLHLTYQESKLWYNMKQMLLVLCPTLQYYNVELLEDINKPGIRREGIKITRDTLFEYKNITKWRVLPLQEQQQQILNKNNEKDNDNDNNTNTIELTNTTTTTTTTNNNNTTLVETDTNNEAIIIDNDTTNNKTIQQQKQITLPFNKQFKYLISRAMNLYLRDTKLFWMRLFVTFLTQLFNTFLYFGLKMKKFNNILSFMSALSFVCQGCCYAWCLTSLPIYNNLRRLFYKEEGLYYKILWPITFFCCELLLLIPMTIVFNITLYWSVDGYIGNSPLPWFQAWWLNITLTIFFVCHSLCLSLCSPTSSLSEIFQNVYSSTCFAVIPVSIPITKMNGLFRVLSRILPYFYYTRAIMISQFEKLGERPLEVLINQKPTIVNFRNYTAEYWGYTYDQYGWSLLWLFVYAGFWLSLALFAAQFIKWKQ